MSQTGRQTAEANPRPTNRSSIGILCGWEGVGRHPHLDRSLSPPFSLLRLGARNRNFYE